MSNNNNANSSTNPVAKMVKRTEPLGNKIEKLAYKGTCVAIATSIIGIGAAYRFGKGVARAGWDAGKELVERVGPLLPSLTDEEEGVETTVDGDVIQGAEQEVLTDDQA